ncbi:MAG: beta-galactosidase [Anaerolineae bacterium]|jgi:beta-galactosidase|nr:beta-galactosidase [Anaerolineae bacterium]
MKLGVCYYPEHWSENNWETDAKEMHTAGISIVRIAEFAWAKMEPEEGKYTWDWLDRSVDTLASAGHQIVLCTPTAAPPAWMIEAHPGILPVDEEGRRRRFGSRRHYCPNNKTYHEYSKGITEAMAERYGNHPAVIGWQIDNEFGCYFARCYCETCTTEFQNWLQKKYSDLDELNERWGTMFWSQIYDKWTQIEPHNLTVAEPNPSHVLEYYRFASDSWTSYQQIQIDALRENIPSTQFVTHNIIASQTTIDYHDLARDLDFVAWDSYPTGYAEMGSQDIYAPDEQIPAYAHDTGDPLLTGFFHSLTRGLKQAPYWIMEQQTGAINWSLYNTGVRLGALRLWAWQAAASGAEATVFFRWKASRFGLEQHHAGLRNHDGSADTGYADLLTIKSERDKLDDFIAQPLQTDIGILLDYSTLWALEMQPHRKDFAYLKHLFVFYRACKALGLEPDIISPQADLSRYKILLAPSAFLADEALAQTLTDFTSQGGTLMLGARSGFKDIHNVVTEEPLPGVLRDLAGARVAKWHALPPEICYPLQSELADLYPDVTFWAEALEPADGTKSLANYSAAPFDGLAAITEKPHGNGKVIYCGIYPRLSQAVALIRHLAVSKAIPVLDIPSGLAVFQRGTKLLAMNFTEEPIVFSTKSGEYSIAARDFNIITK